MDKHRLMRCLHQLIALRGRHINMIAQNAIMLDLQRLNAGLRAIAILQSGNDTTAFITQCPRLIQAGVETGGDKAAIARQKGQRVVQSLIKALAQAVQRRALFAKTGNLRRQLATIFRHFIQ